MSIGSIVMLSVILAVFVLIVAVSICTYIWFEKGKFAKRKPIINDNFSDIYDVVEHEGKVRAKNYENGDK